MKDNVLTRERSEKALGRKSPKFTLIVLGGIILGGGIRSLQYIAQALGNDIKYMSLIENWIAWVAALCFIIGWVITHWVESALLRGQINLARTLGVVFLLCVIVLLGISFPSIKDPMLKGLGQVNLPFLISGYSFRFSMFNNEAARLMDLFFVGRHGKKESSA